MAPMIDIPPTEVMPLSVKSCANGQQSKELWVRLPESLFYSIMSAEPDFNPSYAAAKEMSDEWVKKVLKMDDGIAKKWKALDISYMSAICAPRADVDTLKLINDWNGWVFAFDDPFDEGQYDPMRAAEEVIMTLAVLDDVHPPVDPDEHPVRYALQSCWQRFQQRASPTLQHRWKQQLTMYCLGVLQQVHLQQRTEKLTVQEYMDYRAGGVGAYPCLGLMELAEGIDLPHHVVDHPSLKEIARVSVDLVILQNDLCSYKKDLEQGETSNIMFIFKDQGLNDQQAADRIGEMLDECYKRWYHAMVDLLYWGDKIDKNVLKYIEGCRNLALGNLTWSLYTPRYMGDKGKEVRETRMFRLR